MDHFLSIEDIINKKIIIAKIQTDKPWEVSCLGFDRSVYECPMPEEQVAVFTCWYEKYGAISALVTPDI